MEGEAERPQEQGVMAMVEMAAFVGARVVVGVSGSESGPAVLRRAAVEARRRDALLVPVIAWMASDGDSPRPLAALRQSARERLDTAMELAFDGFPEGIRVHPLVLRAEPGRALVATADRADDLLVVGGGRRGWARHIVHGTVTRHCWAHAACEVLIVPRPELPGPADRAGRQDVFAEAGPRCHAGVGYEN